MEWAHSHESRPKSEPVRIELNGQIEGVEMEKEVENTVKGWLPCTSRVVSRRRRRRERSRLSMSSGVS